MALGFVLQALLGFVLGGALGPIETKLPLFIVLYGIFLTLGEVGPGSTIVLTASENFPTAVRGHAVGFAAAWSKAGAAIGTQVSVSRLPQCGKLLKPFRYSHQSRIRLVVNFKVSRLCS